DAVYTPLTGAQLTLETLKVLGVLSHSGQGCPTGTSTAPEPWTPVARAKEGALLTCELGARAGLMGRVEVAKVRLRRGSGPLLQGGWAAFQ
ncbi:hypothetical protein DBR06_SOUSAS16910002, partial [Sousa chinensis]